MNKVLVAVMLFVFYIVSHDAMAVPEDEIFQITRAQEIELTGNTKKKFDFKTTMTYTFVAGRSGKSFTLTLKKHAPYHTNVYRTNTLVAFGFPLPDEEYSSRQVAFYTNSEKTTFLAERCDAAANQGNGSCILTGIISFENQKWTIESANETHFNGMGSDEGSSSSSSIENEANNWKNGVNELTPADDSVPHSLNRRDIHERNRRSVTTTCNIFEAVAVADATVWEYFLERNSGSVSSAEADLTRHYDALFREIDLIYSCLPDRLCLRVYLRDVVIQKNESTDWTLLTASGNVNLLTSLPRCAGFNSAGADAPFCFTRKMIQFGTTVVGIRGSGRFSSVCSNETIEAAVSEDFHNGLPRLASLIIAVISNYCLLQGLLTDEQFLEVANHRRLADQVLALNTQCQLAFGIESYGCDLYNFTAGLVIPNTAICGSGLFCTNNGTCGINQTIVYSGTTCAANQICYKGVCRPDFDCGGLPVPPNGFFTSSGDTGFLAKASLNCFPGASTMTNVRIKCLRDGWQGPSENCTGPLVTTTTTPSTTPTTSEFGVFPG